MMAFFCFREGEVISLGTCIVQDMVLMVPVVFIPRELHDFKTYDSGGLGESRCY